MNDHGNPEADSGSSITYDASNPSQRQTHVAQSPDRASSEQVRSRWTPKPEQILILESIFNSGMVNPPKEETVRIRRVLEKFGPVGDANVFYWFQNRRSRSRRRQRQIQANMEANVRNTTQYDPSSNFNSPNSSMIIPIASGFVGISGSNAAVDSGTSIPPFLIPSSSETLSGSASSSSPSALSAAAFGATGVQGFLSEMGFEDIEDNGTQAIASSFLCTSDVTSDLQYQQPGGEGAEGGGFVTVFINGVPTEVPRGPLDMKAMCGHDFLLVHSSGHPVPINEYGFSAHSLQHGESYFLVAKSI
uniref:Homeobox domain-containing protein n=1 Tax=Kalanchoe fedtschenkoi TaxID=63787 RepID=A0A7N0VKG6_KALFE